RRARYARRATRSCSPWDAVVLEARATKDRRRARPTSAGGTARSEHEGSRARPWLGILADSAAVNGRGHEPHEGQLRPRAQAHGGPARPRAGTDVDPQAAETRESRRMRSVDPMNDERPREELAGVRVT